MFKGVSLGKIKVSWGRLRSYELSSGHMRSTKVTRRRLRSQKAAKVPLGWLRSQKLG